MAVGSKKLDVRAGAGASDQNDALPSPALRVTRPSGSAAVQVIGEVDPTTQAVWEQAVASVAADADERYLDLSALSFIDVRGVETLVDVAQRLPEGRRLRLVGAPLALRRVLGLLWPEGSATLAIEEEA
ncbi:anti-anti-sigma factor [Streptoalloteichus tenebrarius]|uniref:Anti-anti-sigma factor n=1 Tax=Streptoalloteichus tenebrarius (strain ATCC 17920 / DSM 40477 / JCM 4838 / CBS 697.72 / NBRC 16177 / NCIMB 11028 / NRRL B-12390 / A12253. 1 / ISP 5477) TaxID=1933 RepID=A0ABT1HTI4_STRSD|nr:STAS domain-containing protein [Streptoalloteichus tenebrarius]MCP2258840.1 anti-anti-sigma factor [Streptoalloteichus tenebrarius]BFE99475.1 hypothetical protein GCM10020241_11510 [Streptoalloteichus tenebrarius]